MQVVRVLGTMLTDQTRKHGKLSNKPEAIVVGTAAHYFVGESFAFTYLLIWKNEYIRPNFKGSLFLGTFSGFFGISVWKAFFSIHPNPPKVPLKNYLPTLFFAHIIFAFATTISYRILEINSLKNRRLN